MGKAPMRVCHRQQKTGDKRMDIVEIYAPGMSYHFRIGRIETDVMEMSDEDAAVDALLKGYRDACHFAEVAGADSISVHSKDTKALRRFEAQLASMEVDEFGEEIQ